MSRAQSKRTATPIQQQIKALQMRVKFLERALTPAKEPVPTGSVRRKRDEAEADARHAALRDYYQEHEIRYYRRNPTFLEIAVKSEQQQADFMRARGLKPDPSQIPKELRGEVAAIRRKLKLKS
jgi:hypothetical protein